MQVARSLVSNSHTVLRSVPTLPRRFHATNPSSNLHSQMSRWDDCKSCRSTARLKKQLTPSLTYLVLGLLALAAFYVYRFTVWAADVGGYYNLLTGHRDPSSSAAVSAPSGAANEAVSAVRNAASTGKAGSKDPKAEVESLVFQLAQALGVKPAELSSAIRPLVDPTAPDPAAVAQAEAEALKAKDSAKSDGPEAGFIEALGEALLD